MDDTSGERVEPTFEERYGPWFCMGCGKPHKLGDPCPGEEEMDADKLTGFDSESDRRDAIRKQIVDECRFSVQQIIEKHAVTKTREERHFLELDVISTLLEAAVMETRSLMMRQEIHDAESNL